MITLAISLNIIAVFLCGFAVALNFSIGNFKLAILGIVLMLANLIALIINLSRAFGG